MASIHIFLLYLEYIFLITWGEILKMVARQSVTHRNFPRRKYHAVKFPAEKFPMASIRKDPSLWNILQTI